MKAIGTHDDRGVSPAMQQLLDEAEADPTQPLTARQRIVEWLVGLVFLATAGAMAFGVDAERSFDPWLAIVMVCSYALASRIRFTDGHRYTAPTQLVLVPMLFVLPTPAVPLLVAAGTLLGNLPEYLGRKAHLDRAVQSLGDSWHAIPPAVVLVVAGSETPQLADWPIYIAALAAQFAGDFAISTLRARAASSAAVRPRLLAWAFMADLLLAPIGFLAALASEHALFSFLLVLPLAVLLGVFSQERGARLRVALELSRAYHGTALLLGELVEADHQHTGGPSRGVVSLSLAVANELGMDERERRNVELGALLHDVGKIAIPNEIINKPGPLSPQEWTVVKTHTLEGQKMLDKVGGVLCDVGRVVRASHERWDGSGYPDGLRGHEIPRAARVVAACDAFHAMTATRPYRSALSTDEAIAELFNNAGTQFDSEVVAALVNIVRRTEPSGLQLVA